MDFVDNNIQKVQVQPEDQVYARNEDIKVYGKLVSMSTENVVADSEQIWDEALKKNQSDINSQTQSKFGEYLPLTGGDINGNLNVDGTVGLNGTLTLGDSLHIEEGNFAFEGENNESLTINSNGLTYAFTETDSQGFKVKEGDAIMNNITVIPKVHNDTDRSVSHISPGMITVGDGSNSANFTPTSIELSMRNDSGDTHVTAKTINTNEVLLVQSKAHGTQTVDTSITPGLIRLHQTPGGSTHVTTIQPTGIRSSMFQLTDGTDQDVLLGDGSTIKLENIISYIQVVRSIHVSGFSIEGTPVTGVADIPEGIYYNQNTYTFVAKSNNKYYTSWKKNPSKNIADESHYGIPSDNGVKPYIGQSYGSDNTLKVASQVASDGSVFLEDVELQTTQQWKRYMH